MVTVATISAAGLLAGCETGQSWFPSLGSDPQRPPDEGMLTSISHQRSVVEIDRTLDAWHDAAAHGDFDAYFACMTDDAVFIGTDASERWVGKEFRAFAKPYFNGVEAWTYRPFERRIVLDPAPDHRVAWFDEKLRNATYGECRGSGVLVREDDGRWRLAQYALSFPVPNDLAKDITGQIRAFQGEGR